MNQLHRYFHRNNIKMMFIVLLVTVVTLIYHLNKFLFHYWSRRGFKQLHPKFTLGDAESVFKLKQSMGEFFGELYKKHKRDRILGVYMSYRPVLVITDAKLVQDILIKDLSSFNDRLKEPLSSFPS